ncbi:MAG TPA: hypothetical protein DCL52_04395 [Flavobacteriaceae bacterium]|nr:MAG: Uncharacterised protein [Flavobacteriaceae bacterium]HAH34007.1 hypothetical protein [Flavobacteriaceae bacterium]|tara:strand:+ start:166 stop:537 length:372 start_codon:yes stop_codon:yes gene_type:complete
MNIAKRFGFYGFGFIIGLVLLFFFLNGKKAGCDYGPDARTLKNIKIKQRVFSTQSLQDLKKNNLDTATVSSLLKLGDVNFGESNTKLDSCKVYVIEGSVKKIKLKMSVQNCEKTATITSIAVQ